MLRFVGEWERKFLWFPVVQDDCFMWLKTIERVLTHDTWDGETYYEYRLLK